LLGGSQRVVTAHITSLVGIDILVHHDGHPM
jgi:hypothetical protein